MFRISFGNSYLDNMEFSLVSAIFLLIIKVIHCHVLDVKNIANLKNAFTVEEEIFDRSATNLLKRSANQTISLVSNPFERLLNLHTDYIKYHSKPIKISSSNIEIPNFSHWSEPNFKMHFEKMRFFERSFNNKSAIQESIAYPVNQSFEMGIIFKDWPMEFIGSVILERLGETNKTVNFSIPFTFNLIEENNLKFTIMAEFFNITHRTPVKVTPSFYEKDLKFVHTIRTYGLFNFQYLKREINYLLTTAMIKNTAYYTLPALPKIESDIESREKEYSLYHYSDNNNTYSCISLKGLQKFVETSLETKVWLMSNKTEYAITIVTKNITGTGQWYFKSDDKTLSETGRFSLSAKYVRVIMTKEVDSTDLTYEIKIPFLTITTPQKSSRISSEVQNYLNFLRYNFQQIITESFNNSFQRGTK